MKRKALGKGLSALLPDPEPLAAPAEWPGEAQTAAKQRAPYRLTHFVEGIAARFHRFYGDCRVVTDDTELTQARLWLCAATRQTVANALGVLGVSAPESMDRIGDLDEDESP